MRMINRRAIWRAVCSLRVNNCGGSGEIGLKYGALPASSIAGLVSKGEERCHGDLGAMQSASVCRAGPDLVERTEDLGFLISGR